MSRSLKGVALDSLRDSPADYVRALGINKQWKELIDISFDPVFAEHVLGILKVPFVYKHIFSEMSVQNIVDVLDRSNDLFRREYFAILVKRYQKVPSAKTVRATLMSQRAKYPWIQSYATSLSLLLNEEEYGALLDNMQASELIPVKLIPSLGLVRERSDLGAAVCRGYVNELRKVRRLTNTERLIRLTELLKYTKDLWFSNKEMYDFVKGAVRSYKYILSSDTLERLLAEQELRLFQSQKFPVVMFYEWKMLDDDFILENYVIKAFEEEESKPLASQSLLRSLVRFELTKPRCLIANMLRQSRINLGSLGMIWKRMEDNRADIIADDVSREDYRLFQSMVKMVNSSNANRENSILCIRYEECVEILEKVVKTVLGKKEALSKTNPEKYSMNVTSILYIILGGDLSGYNNLLRDAGFYCRTPNTNAFYMINSELRDRLVRDVVVFPSESPTNQWSTFLSQQWPMRVMLSITNLKTLAKTVCAGLEDKSDPIYGFVSFNVNFPPLPGDVVGEEVKSEIHLWERYVIKNKMLWAQNSVLASCMVQAYKRFTLQILEQANNSNDPVLIRHATGVYLRFCRLMIGKTREELEGAFMSAFKAVIVCPLALTVGRKNNAEFAQQLLELITKVPITNSEIYVHIVNQLLHYACYTEESEDVAETIIPEILRVIKSIFPYPKHGWNNVEYEAYDPFNMDKLRVMEREMTWRCEYRFEDVDHKFDSMVIYNMFSKKARSVYKYNDFVTGVAEARASIKEPVRPSVSSRCVMRLVKFIQELIAERVAMASANTEKATNSDGVSKELEQLINDLQEKVRTCITTMCSLLIAAPIASDRVKLAKMITAEEYEKILRKAEIKVEVDESVIPILKNYAALHPQKNLLNWLSAIDTNATYKSFFDAMAFRGLNEAGVARYDYEKCRPVVCVCLGYDCCVNVLIKKCTKRIKVSKKDCFYTRELADFILAPILSSDVSAFVSANPSDTAIYRIGAFLGQWIRYVTKGPYNGICEQILNILIKDLCIVDEEATKENPKPVHIKRLFEGTKVKLIGKKEASPSTISHGRSRLSAKRTDNKTVQPYKYNEFLIAVLCRAVQDSRFIDVVDVTVFADALLNLFALKDDQLTLKFGKDNFHKFSNALCDLVLSKIKFGHDIKDYGYIEHADQLINVYYKFLSSSVFHFCAANSLYQYVTSLPKLSDRQAVLSVFIAYFKSLDREYTLHSRLAIIKWIMTPTIVGYPMPQFVMDFLNDLATDEKLHCDVRRAIVANAAAFFVYQQNAEITEMTNVEDLMAIIVKLTNSAKSQMIPFCISILDISIRNRLMTVGSFCSLFPEEQLPIHYMTNYVAYEKFPRNGIWQSVYEDYVSSVICPGLILQDSVYLNLVIEALTGLCEGKVSEAVDDFMSKGLMNINPSQSSEALVNFAIHFCFSESNRKFERSVDAFVDLFARLRVLVDELGSNVFEYVVANNMSNVSEDINSLSAYINTISKPIMNFYKSKIAKLTNAVELNWIVDLSSRINAVVNTTAPLVTIERFTEISYLFQILSSKQMETILTRTSLSWLSFLELIQLYGYNAIIDHIQPNNDRIPYETLMTLSSWEIKLPRGLLYRISDAIRYLDPVKKKEVISKLVHLWKDVAF